MARVGLRMYSLRLVAICNGKLNPLTGASVSLGLAGVGATATAGLVSSAGFSISSVADLGLSNSLWNK